MWRGDENLGLDEKAFCLDTAHGPGPDTQRLDPQAAFSNQAP